MILKNRKNKSRVSRLIRENDSEKHAENEPQTRWSLFEIAVGTHDSVKEAGLDGVAVVIVIIVNIWTTNFPYISFESEKCDRWF